MKKQPARMDGLLSMYVDGIVRCPGAFCARKFAIDRGGRRWYTSFCCGARFERDAVISYCLRFFAKDSSIGELSEWLKEHAWKACIRGNLYREFESLTLRQ